MRADEIACGEYAAEKARLAATGMGVSDYADAKEPWFDAVHEPAEGWARETGWEPRRG
jgi:dephospho-CoA kinase